MAKLDKSIQFHFTVPKADEDVIRWINSQDTLSISIRAIIKETIKREGFTDVFCKPVSNPGVSSGRPKKQIDNVDVRIEQMPDEGVQQIQSPTFAPMQKPAQSIEEAYTSASFDDQPEGISEALASLM